MRKVKFTKELFNDYPYEVIVQPIIHFNTDAYEGGLQKLRNGNYDSMMFHTKYMYPSNEVYLISENDKNKYETDFNKSFVGKNGYQKLIIRPVKDDRINDIRKGDNYAWLFKGKQSRSFSELNKKN